MRAARSIFLFALIATTSCSLLEMSQSLWTKVLEGGLTKIGTLDPLRVPVVKVDQSEGNTSYRMILKGVEIMGLNSSSLESIHIARGPLKTNLSEHEAGYVSYTDQRELDTIRYRFNTVVKEPKSQNLEVRPIGDLDKSSRSSNGNERSRNNDYSSRAAENGGTSSRYRDNRERIVPQDERRNQETLSRYENDRRNYQTHRENYQRPEADRTTYQAQQSQISPIFYRPKMTSPSQGQTNYDALQAQVTPSFDYSKMASQRQESSLNAEGSSDDRQENSRTSARKNIPGRVRVVYAERMRYPEDRETNQRFTNPRSGVSGCAGSCEYRRDQGASSGLRENRRRDEEKSREEENIGVAASMNFESRRAYVDARVNSRGNSQDSVDGRLRNGESSNDNRYAVTFDEKIDRSTNDRGQYQRYNDDSSSRKMESQPGYVDIMYSDGKGQSVKHFGNLKVQPGKDTTVYSLQDALRDLRDNKRFIIHNFTEGEALSKRNDAVRTANESRRIKDLMRYARDFQEKNGYYEEGMQLIYHYGGKDDNASSKNNEGKRTKRAHLDDEEEDDIMHVILKIRVPMLRVNTGYVLMGKVGELNLRGNGLLTANFTELIGDFTLELKKVDNETMIVRAARARLTAGDKKITLQGMDEEGPVKEILTEGLMAAEAVAAMLADDLTTKALSEKTADSIIYRMYKNLPTEN